MTDAMFNILVRVISRRVKAGESLSEILDSYSLDNETRKRLFNAVTILVG